MKYFKLLLFSVLLIIFAIGCFSINITKNFGLKNADYLRLHIRANSNLDCDQNIKFQVKNSLLNLISNELSYLNTKEEFENYFLDNKGRIEGFINEILLENNFDYIANVTLQNEFFPTRTYNNVTLAGGFYDAIIIELGKAEGNNWWCVAYPPLCFMYESNDFGNITYKSRLLEIINKFFKE
ncbi:MAG: stage II sporulation protein R [Christensenellales bacterium]